MKKVNLAVIGLGERGYETMRDTILPLSEYDIVAVCDSYADRVTRAVEEVKKTRGTTPFGATDYQEILALPEVDAVYVSTSWETHSKISIDAMYAGKAVAMEVCGAADLQECYDLVSAYEKTKTPFMMMENCCFGKDELLATSLARNGLLGEVVHCHGAYGHDLRDEVCGGNKNRHYRLRHYRYRNADNYPTHDLGPIAKLLNINRGNRMLYLTSIASKSAGLNEYIKAKGDAIDSAVKDLTFAQGDIVSTTIKCAGGETITLSLDTTLPRFYSREFNVRGTKGLYDAPTGMVFLDGMKEGFDTLKMVSEYLGNCKEYEKDYLPKIWADITPEEIEKGHGGMDTLEFQAFYSALTEGKPMPVDVYDAAAWMSITALTERSIAAGGTPQHIPDFTNGAWVGRSPMDVTEIPMISK